MTRPLVRRDERGSISVWAVLIVTVFAMIAGVSVDLTGQIQAKERAADIAAQAARVAGQQADPNALMDGRTATVNPLRARQAALAYIAGAGMTGAVDVQSGGTELRITTTAGYQPIFLGAIGIGPLTVTGTSTARLVRTHDGNER